MSKTCFLGANILIKNSLENEAIDKTSTMMQNIVACLGSYCKAHGIPLTVTEAFTTKEHDEKIGRKSDTHRTGRAVDIRTRDLQALEIEQIIKFLNTNFSKFGAISSVTNGPRIVVKESDHLHIQINREYSV